MVIEGHGGILCIGSISEGILGGGSFRNPCRSEGSEFLGH